MKTNNTNLTERQELLLQYMASGLSVKEISGMINLSQTTVRNDIRKIMRNLGCINIQHMVAKAIISGTIVVTHID
ncbi:helix-turn-helix transcriptional regulator [Rhizobium sp. C4]|uniref:helix-turn-helix transcriptional regulator n=1 Tax=Rhizobium sp. C4 TaxID=1349800 RepID=UPI003FA7ABFF